MESRKTAMQLLMESIDSELKAGTKMVVNWDMYLQMEKEQIMDAWDKGDCCVDLPNGDWEQKYKSAEEFYNETYDATQLPS